MRALATNMVVGLLFGIVCISSDARAQGSLTPPGAPAPTLKTLAQVEPRTAISSAPYTITQPGSYYLTTNLTTTGHGVVIQADRVTVDLMGFAIIGDRGGTDYGIWVAGATNAFRREIVVHNGSVRSFNYNVRCDYMQNSRLEQLRVSDSQNNGIHLNGQNGRCNGNTIAHCTSTTNAQYAISLFGQTGQCNGNTIANCVISGNVSSGVSLTGSGTSGQCNGNAITGCVISDNNSFGISLSGNTGMCEGNLVAGCVVINNKNKGIYLNVANRNRIENNVVSGTTGTSPYGIHLLSTSGNLVLRNSCMGQVNNYSISANDTYGPIVTTVGVLATTGADAHPWANFSK